MTQRVLGIDLGTTNSCAAILVNDEIHVIPDETGQRTQASVVSFLDDGTILVGNLAKDERVMNPANTIYSAKRLIGREFDSPEVSSARSALPFRVVKGRRQESFLEIRGERYALPEISGMIVRRMKDLAEAYLGQPIERAVITVPANFSDTQRQMTKLAGELAGLDVLRVINEPTAAALAYGYGHDVNARVAIYDFGGGTFDISLLDIRQNVFEVIGTAGDSYLGGDDIDDRLARYMRLAFEKQHGLSLDGDLNAWNRLKFVAEKTKRELSETERAIVNVHELAANDRHEMCDLRFQLDRKSFNARVKDIVERTFLICDEALRNARITVDDLNEIIMVGGSTRLPIVREMIHGYFGVTPLNDINPDEVVAVGAAIQGAALVNDHFEADAPDVHPLLLDITPQSLGIQTINEYFDILIDRNSQTPCEQTKVFTTTSDQQTIVRIRIYQGESRQVSENVQLGEVELFGLRAAPRGEVQIEVKFEVDTNGMVSVSAIDLETGLGQSVRLEISAGYDEGAIAAMKARLQS
ncbi:MAG: Hsp70 family protein [Myxococcota bacterium]|nr:Hsp70 family protein [Myxococcota bacterium]